MQLMTAHRVITLVMIVSILDTVRTRVLDFALAVEKKAPNAGEAPPGKPPLPREAVVQTFNVTIMGGMANIGNSGHASIGDGNKASMSSTQGLSGASVTKLLQQLQTEAEQVPKKNRTKAIDLAKKLEEEAAKPNPNLARVKQYLELYGTFLTVASPTVQALKAWFGG